MSSIGWIGSILLAMCGIPEAYRTYKNKKCGIGWSMLLMWIGGEALATIYVISKLGILNPLILNYFVNIFAILIMIFYKVKESYDSK